MANQLEKDKSLQLISPGSPGKPAVAGVPYRAAYYITSIESITTVTYVNPSDSSRLPLTFVPKNPLEPGSIDHWEYPSTPGNGGKSTVKVTTTKQVEKTEYVPEQTAVAAVPAVPPSPAQYRANYNLGWNSGAESSVNYIGDMAYTFTIPSSVAGVITGLSNPAHVSEYTAAEIDYGWCLSNGVAKVFESGIFKSGGYAFSSATVFKVERSGTSIIYSIDATPEYISAAASTSFNL